MIVDLKKIHFHKNDNERNVYVYHDDSWLGLETHTALDYIALFLNILLKLDLYDQ